MGRAASRPVHADKQIGTWDYLLSTDTATNISKKLRARGIPVNPSDVSNRRRQLGIKGSLRWSDEELASLLGAPDIDKWAAANGRSYRACYDRILAAREPAARHTQETNREILVVMAEIEKLTCKIKCSRDGEGSYKIVISDNIGSLPACLVAQSKEQAEALQELIEQVWCRGAACVSHVLEKEYASKPIKIN